MITIFQYGILLVHSVIIWQDFRTRSIHWIIIPVLILLFMLSRYNAGFDWKEAIGNVIFLSIILIGLTLYFSLKERQWINPIDSLIGLGDILYFVTLTLAFSAFDFVFYFITGLLFSLFIFLIYTRFRWNSKIELPLAGTMSIWYMLLFLYSNFYNNGLGIESKLLDLIAQ